MVKIRGRCTRPWINRRCLAGSISGDRKSTRLNSSHLGISYAVFCLKKKKKELQTTPANTRRNTRVRKRRIRHTVTRIRVRQLNYLVEYQLGTAPSVQAEVPDGSTD